MCHNLLENASLFQNALAADQAIAEAPRGALPLLRRAVAPRRLPA